MKPIWQRRCRYLISASVALAITGMVVGTALADAPDPKIPSQNQTYFRFPTLTTHDNGNGTTTVTVTAVTNPATGVGAGWVWTTHHKDCNTDRAGVGFAVDWNDPQDPGFHVTTLNGDSIDVGSTLAVNGNTVDNVVHPTPGTKVSSTVDGTGKEVDVATPSQYQLWRGGCGTFTRDLNGDGVLDPEGNWGPRNHVLNASGIDTGAQNGGISHTYLTSDVKKGITICAIMYDVHPGKTPSQNGGVGIPGKASEITGGGSGHNSDNGAEKNSGTPVGNACVPIPFPVVSVTKTCTAAVNSTGTGVNVTFSGQVTNDGNVALSNIVLSNNRTGTVFDNPCTNATSTAPCCTSSTTLQPKESGVCPTGKICSCSYSGRYSTTTCTPSDTVTVTASSTAGGVTKTATATASASCSVTPAPTARISVTKCCQNHFVADSTGRRVERVDFKGQVCACTLSTPTATSCAGGTNSNVQLTGVTLTNNKGGVTTAPSTTLNPGACSPYSGTYFPTDPSTCTVTDTVTASGSGICGTTATNTATASCSLCPPSSPCP